MIRRFLSLVLIASALIGVTVAVSSAYSPPDRADRGQSQAA